MPAARSVLPSRACPNLLAYAGFLSSVLPPCMHELYLRMLMLVRVSDDHLAGTSSNHSLMLRAGSQLVIVPSTWEAGIPFDYVLLLHAHGTSNASGVSLVPQRSRASLQVSSARGAWLAGLGGGVASPTFTSNPQFLLSVRPSASASSSASGVQSSGGVRGPVQVLLTQASARDVMLSSRVLSREKQMFFFVPPLFVC